MYHDLAHVSCDLWTLYIYIYIYMHIQHIEIIPGEHNVQKRI
jgi:hypothetical protein